MANVAQRLESQLAAYPGMMADETVIWRAWASLHQSEYDRFDHNFRLGPGHDPGPQYLPQVRQAEILNSQMRLDSVGWHGVDNSHLPSIINGPADVYAVFPSALVEIMEVKRRATLSAVGEILGHYHGWVQEFGNHPLPTLRIICTSYANTILPATRGQGITIDLIKVNFFQLSNAANLPK